MIDFKIGDALLDFKTAQATGKTFNAIDLDPCPRELDPHYQAAARLFDKPIREVTLRERQAAKAVHFVELAGGDHRTVLRHRVMRLFLTSEIPAGRPSLEIALRPSEAAGFIEHLASEGVAELFRRAYERETMYASEILTGMGLL